MTRRGGRLTLHRETMRVLATRELARVAGGTVEYSGDGWIAPKSNAWGSDTGEGDRDVANYTCSLVG